MTLVVPSREERGVGRFIQELVDPRPAISDAWWAVTNPRDRLMGRGRASNGQMAFPLGGRWAPKTPGLRAEALQRGDFVRNYRGNMELFGDEGRELGFFGLRGYNLRNEKDEIVASLQNLRMGRDETFIDQLYVDERYRKTPAMMDLLNIATRGGKLQPHGAIANPRLLEVMKRRFDPERQKLLKTVAKVKAPPPKKPTQLDHDIRKLRLEAEMGRFGSRQVTNRDIGHPLAPVRRPLPPRPEQSESALRVQRRAQAMRTRFAVQESRFDVYRRDIDRIRQTQNTYNPRRRGGV